MKKTLGIVLALALVLSVGTVSIFASGNGESTSKYLGTGYVDEDSDGICDNYQGNQYCKNQSEKNCQNKGGSFVDENGDGVCDNYIEDKCQNRGEKGGNGDGHHRYNHQKGQCNE